MSAPAALLAALAQRRPGHALPRAFVIDPEIYEHELQTVWHESWLFAGCSTEAREPGDFFRFDLGDHSLLIVRDGEGALRALHNTCRHRGMPVCDAPAGHVKRWVCPYHQWSYSLDGRLLGCGGIEDELDRSNYGLIAAPIMEVGGLAYVWLGSGPPVDVAQAVSELGRTLGPQGLSHARIAHRIEYDVRANWKLVWENNRECWHCHVGHPEYIKANFDLAPDTASVRRLIAARAKEHARALAASSAGPSSELGRGVDTGSGAVEQAAPGLYPFPSPGRWWSANRTPLAPGFVTESLDGTPVAPLMGDYAEHDVGTLRIRTLPNFWCHASSDHAVLTRLGPSGPERTQITVRWLVSGDAVEGRHYDLDRLLPFWRRTSEQDWELCERNHAGVRNPAFVPGPYSRRREHNVLAFVEWYLERIRAEGGSQAHAPRPPR